MNLEADAGGSRGRCRRHESSKCRSRAIREDQLRPAEAGCAASISPITRRSICPVVIPRRLAAASNSIACHRGSRSGSSTTSWSMRATSDEIPSNSGCTLSPTVECVSGSALGDTEGRGPTIKLLHPDSAQCGVRQPRAPGILPRVWIANKNRVPIRRDLSLV